MFIDKIRKEKKATLITISRRITDDGKVEYSEVREEVDPSDVPEKAVHVTGRKGEYALIDMEPLYPDYIIDDDDVGESDPETPRNWIDATGYYLYYMDPRMAQGYDALGQLKTSKPQMEFRQIVVIGVVVIVGFWMIMRMIS